MNRQEYLLVTLAEELNEAAQACMKALRFGLQDINPTLGITNAHHIEVEIQEALAVRDMLRDLGALCRTEGLEQHYYKKKDRVEEYWTYSQKSLRYRGK